MKKLSREQMKNVMGGRTQINCQVSFVTNPPAACTSSYITSWGCTMSDAGCINSANLLANSDSLCFVPNSGCCNLA